MGFIKYTPKVGLSKKSEKSKIERDHSYFVFSIDYFEFQSVSILTFIKNQFLFFDSVKLF